MKYHWKLGTGSNGIAEIYFWDGSDWDDVKQKTNGADTLAADTIRFINNQDGVAEENYWDDIHVHAGSSDPFTGDPS